MNPDTDISDLWVSLWNEKTHGLTALPIDDALRDVNLAIVAGNRPDACVIAVLNSLEACLSYNREFKRVLKKTTDDNPPMGSRME